MTDISGLLAGSGLEIGRQLADGSGMLYLHSGQIHVSVAPRQISTIVGSCVAVCIWDDVAAIGGMNHYLLPEDLGDGSSPRFAPFAIRRLIEDLERAGARRSSLQAKLFGGASVMSSLPAARHLGTRNVQAGRARLLEAGIPVVAEETGGTHGRKIVFSTASGVTLVKKV
jgi:chemotaxis protein CheD